MRGKSDATRCKALEDFLVSRSVEVESVFAPGGGGRRLARRTRGGRETRSSATPRRSQGSRTLTGPRSRRTRSLAKLLVRRERRGAAELLVFVVVQSEIICFCAAMTC